MVINSGNVKQSCPETSELDVQSWRRKCGCIRTSDKLNRILNTFPSPPPPTPLPVFDTSETINSTKCPETCISGYCYYATKSAVPYSNEKKVRSRSWHVVSELVQLVQLSVTATALAIYYLIYCYMQLVYYTLRSAIYFHNADGPMKVTIGVVTLTSIVVGFNLLVRLERLVGILY